MQTEVFSAMFKLLRFALSFVCSGVISIDSSGCWVFEELRKSYACGASDENGRPITVRPDDIM